VTITYTRAVQVIPSVTASAYTSGQSVGGLMTFASLARVSGWGGLVQTVTAVSNSGVAAAMDLILFSSQRLMQPRLLAWSI
jgi:hypothetical protein